MSSKNIIDIALSYQNENNSFIKTALSYTGCSLGDFNIVYLWFESNNDDDMQRLKKKLGFPNLAEFKSNWWKNEFINKILFNTKLKNYYADLLNRECDDSDPNSKLIDLGNNNICKTSRYSPYIQKEIWDKVDDLMNRIIRTLFVITYKTKMSNDDSPENFYRNYFGLEITDSKKESKTKLSDQKNIDLWKEIPPKLLEKFECQNKEIIEHSYTYIKEQIEKFITDTYFSRNDTRSKYDHALNVLMSRFKNASFNYDDFWKLLANKYKKNSEVKKILLTEIEIKCPTTASGKNLFIKSSCDVNNNFGFFNHNSINYKNIKISIKYNMNLPSRILFALKTFTDPYIAACELNLPAGLITRGVLASYYSSVFGATPSYDDKYMAWTFLFQYIKNNGPYAHSGCGTSSSTSSSTSSTSSSSSIIPVSSTTSTGGSSSSSTTGTSSSTTTPPSAPPTPTVPGTIPTPAPMPPTPTPNPKICKAKFYDLGFIDYCAFVLNPKELKDLTEQLINTIQNLQFVELSKQVKRADIFTDILDKTSKLSDTSIDFAELFLGKK